MHTATSVNRRFVAKPVATSVEIWCPNPNCSRHDGDPIPSRDGSFLWDCIPDRIECPICRGVFRVSKRVLTL